MLEYSKDGITIATYLDTRRHRADGRHSLKIRVTYARKCAYYPTGKSFTPNEWAALPRTRTREAMELRKDVEHSYNYIRDIVEGLAHSGAFSLNALNVRLRAQM